MLGIGCVIDWCCANNFVKHDIVGNEGFW